MLMSNKRTSLQIILLVFAASAALFASCSSIDIKKADLTRAEKNAIVQGLDADDAGEAHP